MVKEPHPPVPNESSSPAYDKHIAEKVTLDEKEEKKKMSTDEKMVTEEEQGKLTSNTTNWMSVEVSRGVLKKHKSTTI